MSNLMRHFKMDVQPMASGDAPDDVEEETGDGGEDDNLLGIQSDDSDDEDDASGFVSKRARSDPSYWVEE